MKLSRIDKFTLADVGASGGIDNRWKLLGNKLEATGFDPLIKEIEILNETASNNIEYINAYIANDNWKRNIKNIPLRYNSGFPIELCNKVIQLDDYFTTIDFIKIDTDGSDIFALRSADRLLNESVVGVQIECILRNRINNPENNFCTINTYIHNKGFSLYDLDIKRYKNPRKLDLVFADALYLKETKETLEKMLLILRLYNLPYKHVLERNKSWMN